MNTSNSTLETPTPVTRRQFLGTTAAAAAFLILPRYVVAGADENAPSAKLNIAGIGIGGMGASNLANLESENIVALCDVDLNYAAKTIAKYPNAKVWTDYREMLEKQKDIDAVLIATPDHTHAVIAMAAIKAGKHVYCQKPLCHDLYEARMLARAAAESKVATQMGIQGHSSEGFRLICEWIGDGAIGEVREVDAWCSLTYYPWGHESWSSKWGEARPKDTPALPDKLNWDIWLGPTPERPYHPAYHPAVWRCWWDFGNGMMGDRGAHSLDPVVSALKLGPPTSVEATSCGLNPETHPLSAIVTFQFPARGELPPVKLTWYEGLRPPRPPQLEDNGLMPQEGGVIFKGSEGALMCGVYGDSPRLIPETAMQAYKRPPKTLPRVKGSHEMDWVKAAKAGRQPGAHFGYSGPLTETCLLGNIAKRVDARIEWDAANLKITNLPDANRYVRAEYRKGWSL
jgi:predicted dehydrogenase